MRNHFSWLCCAVIVPVLTIFTGCQSPRKSAETADQRPPAPLLGDRFDPEQARQLAQQRRADDRSTSEIPAGDTATATGTHTPPNGRPEPSIRQTSANSRPETPQTSEAIAAHIRQGSEAMRRRDWAAATIHYEAILSADPHNPLAHQMLGRIGDQTEKFENAEYHYLRALSSRPRDANLLSDLGYSYLQQGRLADSRKYLLQALSIDPEHQMAHANLAAVEAYSGKTDAALALLRRISSEEQAYQTLHELLSQPAPFVQRQQLALQRDISHLPLNEQMRLARETARRERERREQLEELDLQHRVRQAMALDGPLAEVGRGVGDEELGELIARIGQEDRVPRGRDSSRSSHTADPSGQHPSDFTPTGGFAAGPQYPTGAMQQPGAHSAFGPPPQQTSANGPAYGHPAATASPESGQPQHWSGPAPAVGSTSPDAVWNQQTPQLMPPGSQQQPQSATAPGQWPQQQWPQQQWPGQQAWPAQQPAPAQHLQGSVNPQLQPAPGPDGHQWQQYHQAQPQGSLPQQPAAGSPPVLNNLQDQNALLYQQQAGGLNAATPIPNGSLSPAGTLPPSGTGLVPTGTPESGFNKPQYVPPGSPGVWNPQNTQAPAGQMSYGQQSYGHQPGQIQQLGHQQSAGAPRPTQQEQQAVRQAMHLGMAAGPGSLIRMNQQPASRPPNGVQSSRPVQQQLPPAQMQPPADQPSPAVWNSGVSPQTGQSPAQNLWQTGPMPTSPPAGQANDAQWQNLPSAQQQPQSSTWNHQQQQPNGPLESRNWTTAQTAGTSWQPDSHSVSPTASDSFARGFMLHPDPTRADTQTTVMAGLPDLNGSADNVSTAPSEPSTGRIPWTVR